MMLRGSVHTLQEVFFFDGKNVFLRRKNVRSLRYMYYTRGQMHTVAKQIKSVKFAAVWGETLEKSLFTVLNTPEKDSKKGGKQPKI